MATWRSIEEKLARELQADEASLRAAFNAQIKQSAAEIESQIAEFYQKYGREGVLEYRDLVARLSPQDRQLLYRDMQAFRQKYPQYASIIEPSTSIYQLDRLEALQASIMMNQAELTNREIAMLDAHLARWGTNYANGALESAITFAGSQIALGAGFYRINSAIIRTALANPWSGERFSSRIWNNNQELGRWLNTEFANAVARGDSYEKIARTLRARYENVSRSDIKRLIFTEGTYITNASSAQSFEQEFEQYITSPVHDPRTCQICLNAEAVQQASPPRFDQRQPGVNFPPYHPWCRCSFIVHVEDWDTWLDERTGRMDTAPRSAQQQYEDYIRSNNMTTQNLMREWTGEGYRKVRGFQSGRLSDALANTFATAIEMFIDQSEKYVGTLYRGANIYNQEAYNALVKGNVIDQRGTSSWSSSQEVADDFKNAYDDNPVIFVTESTQGVSIMDFSEFPTENEVIYSKDQRWEITRTSKTKGVLFVYLKELLPG